MPINKNIIIPWCSKISIDATAKLLENLVKQNTSIFFYLVGERTAHRYFLAVVVESEEEWSKFKIIKNLSEEYFIVDNGTKWLNVLNIFVMTRNVMIKSTIIITFSLFILSCCMGIGDNTNSKVPSSNI